MRAVFTVPDTVTSDARYAGAGPGRLHLNACGCGRMESIAGANRKNDDRVGRSRNEDRVGRSRKRIASAIVRVLNRRLIASNDGNPLKTDAGAVS